ncbi:PREDICTED: putative F-box protein At1g71320 [Camelina sativa]|uniref:F-box protein At1g71320 n=1 Tax=Camelina sativa TaxID=90675 RepID=A0ABM0WCB0_CAMSA|nr:PREDICTED: putative F-box protein At1g71320 [Camelina sativa]
MIESNYLAEKRLLRHPNPKLLVLRLEISSDRCSRTIFLATNSKDDHNDHIKIFIHSYKSPLPYPIYSMYDIAGQIMGYCNGLVCIFDLGYIYLINPATRKLRILSPEFLRAYTDRTGWSNELPISVGFGRDMVTGTYKVILMYLYDRHFIKTEALNLESGERRYVHFPILYDELGDDKRSIFANGSLYWLPKPLSLFTNKLIKLAAIDLHTETFRYVSLPSWYTKYSKSVYLWSLKDSLCLSDVQQTPRVDVWSLQQEDPSVKWEKIFSVNILSTNCLDANFWKLGLAAYYFSSTGRYPANNPLDQVPNDHCSSVLYTEKLGSSV